ncbi:MAG TPA: GGDEF domain-containing protein [Candidatus Omnitrophota bacterium]|nr:GGDEF domain-containing protein [Candidatus Omnitrophota bacterium]
MFFLVFFIFGVFSCLAVIFFKISLIQKNDMISAEIDELELRLKNIYYRKDALERKIDSANSELTKTIKIYETARDISSSLDEEKLLSRFNEDLNKFVEHVECLLLPEEGFDPVRFEGSAVFPLFVKERCLGYLVITGSSVKASPYVGILVANFALGLKRARLYRIVQELATTDSLTGVFTRRYAFERLREEFLRAQAHELNLSFIMIDVDDFKECNDKMGHLVGDLVLAEIAHRIKENIREVDMLARFGGEEFLVFAPNTAKESAALIAERIRKGVEAELIRAYDEKIKATVSIGLATYPQDAKNQEDLIGKADWALYQSKRLGKNRVSVFGAFKE